MKFSNFRDKVRSFFLAELHKYRAPGRPGTKFCSVVPNTCESLLWTRFMSHSWRLEFYGGAYVFGKICALPLWRIFEMSADSCGCSSLLSRSYIENFISYSTVDGSEKTADTIQKMNRLFTGHHLLIREMSQASYHERERK